MTREPPVFFFYVGRILQKLHAPDAAQLISVRHGQPCAAAEGRILGMPSHCGLMRCTPAPQVQATQPLLLGA